MPLKQSDPVRAQTAIAPGPVNGPLDQPMRAGDRTSCRTPLDLLAAEPLLVPGSPGSPLPSVGYAAIMRPSVSAALAVTLAMLGTTSPAPAQTTTAGSAADPWCRSNPEAAFCHAVRGVRAGGWPAQGRSEVMAPDGMVVTSQPLAAQAGLEVLKQGGNAIDAAVATASVLSLT